MRQELAADQARCRVCGTVFNVDWAVKLRGRGYPVGDDRERMICGRGECLDADPDRPGAS